MEVIHKKKKKNEKCKEVKKYRHKKREQILTTM